MHYNWKKKHQSESESSIAFAIDPPAVLPDLPILPCQRADVPHLNHGRREVPEEVLLVAREPMNNGGGRRRRRRVGQHDLVGRQLSLAVQEVAVVLVVEQVGSDLIQVLQCTLRLPGRAVLPRELALHFAESVRSWSSRNLLLKSVCARRRTSFLGLWCIQNYIAGN